MAPFLLGVPFVLGRIYVGEYRSKHLVSMWNDTCQPDCGILQRRSVAEIASEDAKGTVGDA